VSLVVLLILAVVWAVFLVPQIVRARAERTPADSIGAFRSQLSVLERTSPGVQAQPARAATRPVLGGAYTAVPAYRPAGALPTRSQARKRRREILQALLAATAGSFLLGLVPPLRPMWFASAGLLGLTATYVFLLVRARNIAAEREMKVRYLPGPVPATAEAALVGLRRSGS
jgi:hypothetical protein